MLGKTFSFKRRGYYFFAEDPSSDVKALISNLSDPDFLLGFDLQCDMPMLFSQLNLNIQGKYKFIFELLASIEAFKNRLQILQQQFRSGVLENFKYTKEICGRFQMQSKLLEYFPIFNDFKINFETRFKDFRKIESIINILNNPLLCNIGEQEIRLQDELIKIQSDLSLPLERGIEFWRNVDEQNYPLLKNEIYKLFSMFGTTYISMRISIFVNGFY